MRFITRGLLAALALLVCGAAGAAAQTSGDQPAAPGAVSVKRDQVLAYITSLSTAPSFQGSISGQNCFHGNEITNQNPLKGYQKLVEKLNKETGKWVGIIGVDYEFQKCFTPRELTQANKVLIDYAKAGGLVIITLAPQNPWFNDESDLAKNPGTWDGPAATQNKKGVDAVKNLEDLIDPSKPVNVAWMRKLDRIAAALTELRDAGVVVMFRPLQEMNGNWFWWGMKSHPKDPKPYVSVFRHMHDYFVKTKGLDNLLWVYSPCSAFGNPDVNKSDWNRSVDWAYPGDDYVDIVAGTNYDDDMNLVDYPAYLTLKKPLGIAEFGPRIGGTHEAKGTWDTSKIISTIAAKYPRVAFWVNWHNFPNQNWSIIGNKNYKELMNDPRVINRDKFPWSPAE